MVSKIRIRYTLVVRIMATIELKDVQKRFGDLTAVNGVNLTVEDGEFLVLVGPSGCGKSTLLRTIAGLEEATEGAVIIGNRDMTNVEPKNRHVAMVFQNYALYPHMTARRNMTFGMKSFGSFTDEEIDNRVAEAAEMLDIVDLLDRKPAELSGGEQQRVAMGRALLRDPAVFLLDEPLSNLDAKLRDQMRAELTKLQNELGKTTIYVTHDQTEAMTLGDRVAVMDSGQIQQVDPPQTLYDFPRNRFVAEFIGSPRIDTFPVTIDREDNGFVARRGVLQVNLPAQSLLEDFVGTEMILGVRPEDVYLTRYSDFRPVSDIEVTVTEPLGDSLVMYGEAEDIEIILQTKPREVFEPGDSYEIGFDTERLHLFDPTTGNTVYHSDPSRLANKEQTTTRA